MAEKIITLYPAEQDSKDFVYEYLEHTKDAIEAVVCIVKLKKTEKEEEGIYVAHSAPTLETLCAMLKMFDYVVNEEIKEEMNLDEED